MPSQRWCPTPEQLMILEEIYKGGIRTPKASHIHKITYHLSQYGRIEGKNVFYWFQNHKARDRQKLRRKQLFLAKQVQQQEQQNYHHNSPAPLLYYQPLFLAKQQNYHPLNSHYNLSPFLHQGTGGAEDASSIQFKPNTLKADDPNSAERCEEKSIKRMYGHDYLWMIMNVAPNSCSNRGPLKTLQLFPTTTTTTTTTTTSMHKP